MSQSFDVAINPAINNPAADITKLTNALSTLLSSNSGAARPSYAIPGTVWHKSTANKWYLFDGTVDQEINLLPFSKGVGTSSISTLTIKSGAGQTGAWAREYLNFLDDAELNGYRFANMVDLGGAPLILFSMLAGVLTGVFQASPSGIGYPVGAGATVTQPTSKSTTVTLNKPSGTITMNSASLAAGASVTFTLICSAMVGTDGVVVTVADGFSSNYRVEVAAMSSSGGVAIRVTNLSAGALAEALPINFQTFKGARA